jgi:hypothetical protein
LKRDKEEPNMGPKSQSGKESPFERYIKPDPDSLNLWDLFIFRQTNTELI